MQDGYKIMRNRARLMRNNMTPAEQRLWCALSKRQCGGYRFLRQRVIGQFILDFYCPELKLGIEVDGSVHNLPEVQAHDRTKDEGLPEERGIHIIRFRNTEILQGTPEHWYARILSAASHLPPS